MKRIILLTTFILLGSDGSDCRGNHHSKCRSHSLRCDLGPCRSTHHRFRRLGRSHARLCHDRNGRQMELPGGMSLPGNSTRWKTNTLNDSDGQDQDSNVARSSWVDFSSHSPDTQTRSGTFPYYAGFSAGYSSTLSITNGFALGPVDVTPGGTPDDGDGYGFDNTLLGIFYITHASTSYSITFSGTAGYALNTGGGVLGPVPTGIGIPEPSTSSLLGCCFLGLLGYAWWKHKSLTISGGVCRRNNCSIRLVCSPVAGEKS